MTVGSESNKAKSKSPFYVRLENLPADACQKQVRDFFFHLTVPPGGVSIHRNCAFVAFDTKVHAHRAVSMDQQVLGGKVVRVFNSDHRDVRQAQLHEVRRQLDVDYCAKEKRKKRIRPTLVRECAGVVSFKKFCPDEIDFPGSVPVSCLLEGIVGDKKNESRFLEGKNNEMFLPCWNVPRIKNELCLVDGKVDWKDESCLVDGKVGDKNNESCLIHGKLIDTKVSCLVDGKVVGKKDESCLVDGKGGGKKNQSRLIDGKKNESCLPNGKVDGNENDESCLVDGKVHVKKSETCLVDGNVPGKNNESYSLDGNVLGNKNESCVIRGNVSGNNDTYLLDEKVSVKEPSFLNGNVLEKNKSCLFVGKVPVKVKYSNLEVQKTTDPLKRIPMKKTIKPTPVFSLSQFKLVYEGTLF